MVIEGVIEAAQVFLCFTCLKIFSQYSRDFMGSGASAENYNE